MKKQKIKCKAVIFDLWDTLFFHGLASSPMSEIKKLLVSAGAKDKEIFPAMHKTIMVKNFGENFINFDELSKMLGIKITLRLKNELKKSWIDGGNSTILFEDVLTTLNELKKHYKLGLLSNTTSYRMHYLVKKFELEKYFDAMLFSFDIGIAKPDKKAFELIAQKLGIKCSDCIFVGDQLAPDVLGSANAGMKPILIDREHKYSSKPKEAVAMINSLNELKELLEKG
ncbi:MAG: HAD family hydrolase [archaeon]|nr:HAD family hydrolase [archaeon]